MPVARVPRGGLCVAAVAAVLLAGSSGCANGGEGAPKASSSPSPAPSASVAAPVSATATAAGSPSTASAAPTTRAATPSASPPPSPPAAPTRLTVAVETRGGRLVLVRGGAAQEFTVTLRNGNSADHRHLLVAFQMEVLVGEPGDRPGSGPGFLLERFDRTAGAWRPAELRVANDALPLSLYTGGGPLAREAVRVERYRLRATADGPTGSTPVVVSFVDTDTDREAAAHVLLGHSTG
ncbi:hypothetical protein AB0N09_08960 [Streptomyces erythrochromogenes]|uniref:hypothetical protein n=1 Tax=Streptomyces erythrochromogenes TaxID=285574 RepID=UPI0034198A71